MKGFCESFRKSPMTAFADWQETREPWILFGVTSIILVLLAHYLFQGWLYMLPCEQCVYIRYGNIVMAIGAFLITINPKQALLKIAGIGVFLYGLIYTMICSWKLMGIHEFLMSFLTGIPVCPPDHLCAGNTFLILRLIFYNKIVIFFFHSKEDIVLLFVFFVEAVDISFRIKRFY